MSLRARSALKHPCYFSVAPSVLWNGQYIAHTFSFSLLMGLVSVMERSFNNKAAQFSIDCVESRLNWSACVGLVHLARTNQTTYPVKELVERPSQFLGFNLYPSFGLPAADFVFTRTYSAAEKWLFPLHIFMGGLVGSRVLELRIQNSNVTLDFNWSGATLFLFSRSAFCRWVSWETGVVLFDSSNFVHDWHRDWKVPRSCAQF